MKTKKTLSAESLQREIENAENKVSALAITMKLYAFLEKDESFEKFLSDEVNKLNYEQKEELINRMKKIHTGIFKKS